MNSAKQHLVDFLTSDADDIWSETTTSEEKGISATDALISILQDCGEALSDRQAHESRQIKAAYGLKILHDPRGIPALIDALGKSDEGLALVASNALVAIGLEAVEPLIAALSSPDRDFRSFAIQTLGELHDKRAVEPLISLLQDPRVGWVAARALGTLGDTRAVPALIDAIHTSEPGWCRPFVVALGDIGDPRAIQPLTEFLPSAPDWVRDSVTNALKSIKSKPDEFPKNPIA